jgi:hypothetical protein
MNPQPKVRFYEVTSNTVLRELMEKMKEGARRELLTVSPIGGYAKTLDEAEARYMPHAKKILDDPRGGVLVFPGNVLVTMVTSIDTFDPEKCWHVSMGRLTGPPPPERVSDKIATRICEAFFEGEKYTEGPPEGLFKNVRHFRAPWRPD